MKQSRMVIRIATDGDAPSVKSLARSLATTFQFDGDAFDGNFMKIKSDEDAQILVAVDELGLTIGYLLGFVHGTFFANSAVAWIEEMYVSETSRRRGVGSALEREFGTWATGRGAKLIALATRRASSFYAARGYEESAVYFRRML
jgi:GNAT superfamily N-acetyltransferase